MKSRPWNFKIPKWFWSFRVFYNIVISTTYKWKKLHKKTNKNIRIFYTRKNTTPVKSVDFPKRPVL